jgi:hypothetical protein
MVHLVGDTFVVAKLICINALVFRRSGLFKRIRFSLKVRSLINDSGAQGILIFTILTLMRSFSSVGVTCNDRMSTDNPINYRKYDLL